MCDSNLMVASFNEEDTLSAEAQFVLSSNYDLLLPISALVEIYHLCKPEFRKVIAFIGSQANINVLPEDTALLGTAFDWHHKEANLDLVDCLLLSYAKHVGTFLGWTRPVPIVTSDQRMINIARGFDSSFRFLDLNHPGYGIC